MASKQILIPRSGESLTHPGARMKIIDLQEARKTQRRLLDAQSRGRMEAANSAPLARNRHHECRRSKIAFRRVLESASTE
jgi:hypothetical protein